MLAPESLEARRIAGLAWLLLGGGAAIFAVMLILTWLAMRGSGRVREILSRQATVIGGGLVFPMITLAALLGYGFVLMSAGADGSAAPPGQPALRVSIVGERWWWRVVYGQGEATRIASANEIRIPVGRPVTLELTTQDVIHSFWVPSL
ncbi:MAG: cytochrome C oxidase subunit II, partial [Hyphomicrobiaceae bacterium]